MDKPISAGDMVMIVRWPHSCLPEPPFALTVGTPFIVAHIYGTMTCQRCGAMWQEKGAVVKDRENFCYPLSWLKRIDPSALEEQTHTGETITA